jgi:hypothetical protein
VTKVTDLLALQEASYLYTPLPNMTLYAQGQALAAIKKLNLGASSSNITNVLTNTLGAAASGGGFVGLKLLIATVPASPPATDEPTSNFQQLTLEGKWLQLTDNRAVSGPITVTWTRPFLCPLSIPWPLATSLRSRARTGSVGRS